MSKSTLASRRNCFLRRATSSTWLLVPTETCEVFSSRLQKSLGKNSLMATRVFIRVCTASYVQPKPPALINRTIRYLPPESIVSFLSVISQ